MAALTFLACMKKPTLIYSLFILAFLAPACNTAYQTSNLYYKDYRINNKQPVSNELNQLLKPYADSVNKSMNDVVAIAGMALEKKQPEGTLGNILVDAMLAKTRERFKKTVHAAFINNGGIRLPSIAEGEITRGKIFELAPFDNIIVLVKINGQVLKQFLDTVANRGGWPAAGCTYQVKNKRAINIAIGGKPVKDTDEYSIALVDYIANGGDNCDMFKTAPQENNSYLFRDAIIEYFADMHQQGKKIVSTIENRVTYAE